MYEKQLTKNINGFPMVVWICSVCGGPAKQMLYSKKFPLSEITEPDYCSWCIFMSTILKFGVGVANKPNEIGMLAGPYNTISEALAEIGKANHFIVGFFRSGESVLLYRWYSFTNQWRPTAEGRKRGYELDDLPF